MCFLSRKNAQKCVGSRGSTPDPAGGAYSAPPDPLARLRGPTSKGRGEEGRGGEERGGEEGRGREGRRREGRGRERRR